MGITHPPPSSQPLPILQTCWLIRRSKFRIDLVSTVPSHFLYVVVCATVVGYLPYSLPSFSCNVSCSLYQLTNTYLQVLGPLGKAQSRRKRPLGKKKDKGRAYFHGHPLHEKIYCSLYYAMSAFAWNTSLFCKPWGNLAESHAFMLFLPFSMSVKTDAILLSKSKAV